MHGHGDAGTLIYATPGSPVIAVNNGKIVRIGHSVTSAVQSAAAPLAPASAGVLRAAPAPAQTASSPAIAATALVKERLFAHPLLPASYAAGGDQQVSGEESGISSFGDYFFDVLHLARNQYTLARLRAGAIVVAGTVLGRIGASTTSQASHLYFRIQPGGPNAPHIDPKAILDGWKLLAATSIYRADGIDPFLGAGVERATIGEILLESSAQLQNRVLTDPHAKLGACGRRAVQAGLIVEPLLEPHIIDC